MKSEIIRKLPHELGSISTGFVCFGRKGGLMKVETYSVRTMDGPLMGVDLASRSRRLPRKVQKLVLSSLREHVLRGSPHWSPKACSSFGRMRMVGKEQTPPSLPCNIIYYHLYFLCTSKVHIFNPCFL